MKKILVIGGMVRGGGISEYIFKTYSLLKRAHGEELTIDFMIETGQNDFSKTELVKNSKFYMVCPFGKNPLKYSLNWHNFIKEKASQYDIFHFHLDAMTKHSHIKSLARKGKVVIVHSHNSFNSEVSDSLLKKILHEKGKKGLKKLNCVKFACSDLAAKWLFDQEKEVHIIHNAIDLNKFQFNKEKRKNYRQYFALQEDDMLYAHIGRFEKQKNHTKLIQIFYEVKKLYPKSTLLLIGEGSQKNAIKKSVQQLKLESDVKFLGHRHDISEIMNGVDALIFPSLYEGLPISLVEAQANGMPVYFSDTISKEVQLLGTSKSISLKKDAKEWAKIIHDGRISNKMKRNEACEILRKKGYSLSESVEELNDWYSKLS